MLKITKTLLVTGCPRSGTKSMAHMLKQCGLDTPHEQLGVDGTVSTYFCVPWIKSIPWSSGKQAHVGMELASDFQFEIIIHQVRHPLDCIASAVKIVNKPHQEWMIEHDFIPEYSGTKLHRMMQMWLNINQVVEQRTNVRVRIEDGVKAVRKIAKEVRFIVPTDLELKHMHKASGYNKPKKLTWDDLIREDKSLATEIKKLAKHYGYK